MVRALAGIVLALSLLACVSLAAHAETRLALLIGNQNYASKVGPLKNPRQDVALIEASLKKLGFQVTVLNDADYRAMDIALKRYAAELRRAGPGALGFFYYSGHGAANADTQINYLIPVDVASAEDDNVWYQSFRQNQIVDLLSKEAASATQFLVFDACRNELNLSGGAAKTIGADKGFVPVANTAGLLIAYATAPGRTASDAGDGGGPYAKALAEELLKPGVEAVEMFRHVQIKVKRAIGQDPWLSFPSLDPVYLAGRDAAPAEASKPQRQPQQTVSEAAQAWAGIKDMQDIPVFEAFRKQYGAANPFYDTLAANRIAELKRTAVAIVAPPNAVNAPPVQPREEACGGLLVAVAHSSTRPCIEPGSGESFRDCPDCPEMVVVPAGSFTMGSPANEPEHYASESPQHEVTIAKPFAAGKYAVTRDEFEAFMKASGRKMDGGCYVWTGSEWKQDGAKSYRSPGFEQTGSHPVVCVNWEDATAYAAWLSKRTGKEYRLLTEAEREYAARAGAKTPFWWGSAISPDRANYNGNSVYKGGQNGEWRQKTMPVKSFKPNPWGLYQVHGNVYDWVEDCWHDGYSGAPTDGSAWTAGDCRLHVLRGGSWSNFPRALRAAYRFRDWVRNSIAGFRLARTF
jgi:formylglycine-generating enzyme required for sulfatase activity